MSNSVILTCMDYRIEIEKIKEQLTPSGNVYILRNAGGRMTDDMIRSIIIAIRHLNIGYVYLLHHTDCGVNKITQNAMLKDLEISLGPCSGEQCVGNEKDSHHSAQYVNFLSFSQLENSVIEDYYRLASNELIPRQLRVGGYIYHVEDHTISVVDTKESRKNYF